MSLVVAFDDIGPDQIKRKGAPGTTGLTNMMFFRADSNTPDAPSAFLTRQDPGLISSAHYHAIDQFQVVVGGKGRYTRNFDTTAYCVKFSRAFTPYGPLVADEEGWTMLTFHTRYDPGSQRDFEKLKHMPGRQPWQITKKMVFSAQGAGVGFYEDPEIRDGNGLLAGSLTMAPSARIAAPDPSKSEGQFLIVVEGSLIYENREHNALTVAFVKPEESAFQIQAGPQGLQAIVLNFPQVTEHRAAGSPMRSQTAEFKKWKCELCAFFYDEALGIPEEGIPVGTRWADVPESWSCPDCAASKRDFLMVEV